MYPRIGQKVECIRKDWFLLPCELCPEYKAKDTIRSVGTDEHYPGELFIRLRELVNHPCYCHGLPDEPAYVATGFRPLVDDEAKNEHVTEIIKRVTAPKREPVKVK